MQQKKKNQVTKFSQHLLLYCLFFLSAFFLFFPYFSDQKWLICQSWQQNQVTLQKFTPSPAGKIQQTTRFQMADLKNKKQVPHQAVARLMSPTLPLNETIYAGSQPTTLARGGGWLFANRTLEKDNVVFIGHHLANAGLLFGPLVNSQVGQKLYVRTTEKLYVYQVSSVKQVSETSIEVLANTPKPQLTLITCDSPKPTTKRIVVQAKRIQATDQAKGRAQAHRIQVKSENKKRQEVIGPSVLMGVFLLLFLGIGSYMIERWVKKYGT